MKPTRQEWTDRIRPTKQEFGPADVVVFWVGKIRSVRHGRLSSGQLNTLSLGRSIRSRGIRMFDNARSPSQTLSCLRSTEGARLLASYTVAILGANGGIGQPLSLLVKMLPLVSDLHLYSISSVKAVAADLGHCNTPSRVKEFAGLSQLEDALKGVHVVVITASTPTEPGMTREDLFDINAGIVKSLAEAVADNCPDALVHIISNPINSLVPVVAEVLKRKGVYDPRKLFGVTTLDVVRANTFVAQRKNLNITDVDVPVVGGHAGSMILPLLSKTKPSVSFTAQEVEELTIRIQKAGREVIEAKAGAGSATLSMAYAAARFIESSLRALDGDEDIYECSFVESDLTELQFFASRVKLGKNGVDMLMVSDLQGLTEYEQQRLEALKPELKADIEKGIAFANKQSVTTER